MVTAYKIIASSTKIRDGFVISKPRLVGVPLLESLLEKGDSCFSLSVFMVLKNLFLEMEFHPHRNTEALMRKLTAIQETHAYRPDEYPYLTEEFLAYFGIEEKRAVLDYKNLKLGGFNALVCIQIGTGQACMAHTTALLFNAGKYIFFDPNCKTLKPKGYPNAVFVKQVLEGLLKSNSADLHETRVEKVWYTAAPSSSSSMPNVPEVQSETTKKSAEKLKKNSSGWGWSFFS